MEKKDWKEEFNKELELSYGENIRWLVDVHDEDGWVGEETEELINLIDQELDKAREGQFTQKELERIEELLGFMKSDYPASFLKPEDKSIEKKLSKLKE